MGKLIPFNVPYVSDASREYVLEALASSHQQGDGPFSAKASRMVSDLVGGGHVLLTPSCTHALEMASMLANLGPGDEVILPSFTFTSAATAVTKFGATPVFVDIEMYSKGIDVTQAREAITPKTKAISWVNYAGVAPDIEGLQRLAKEFNLILIEDNAHGLGGTYKGKPLGSFGDFATQSFHATKNIQCGEGGALVINNTKYVERAEIIREKGTNRSEFIRGEVQKYQWVDKGSSYLLAESLAAILLGSLEEFTKIQTSRQLIANTYTEKLSGWAKSSNFMLQPQNKSEINSAHMFYLVSESQLDREVFIEYLGKEGIHTTFHYQSLVDSKQGKVFKKTKTVSVNSQRMSSSLLRLPIYPSLSAGELGCILESILSYHE
jgi:dTDP-4-amino-4,6-dideoxygalactose transaminase